MNFIQTLYFDRVKDPYQNSFGWASPEYHLISWALSSLQLTKLYGKVDLYCNDEAAELLIGQLGLPYKEVSLSHNKLLLPDDRLWALPKIFTYSLQTEPFVHFDGDVFLFERLPSSLLEADLISQNIEEATGYYLQTQKELEDNFLYFPQCVDKDFKSSVPIKAVNAGILGGNNLGFIQEYTSLAFSYINRNVRQFGLINVDRFNVFFEQHLFYSLAKEKNVYIDVLFKSTIKDNQYLYLGNFHETPCKRNYLHLLGDYKRDEHTCKLMASKLRELYPEYYYKIISLFNSKTGNRSFFNTCRDQFSSFFSYLEFSKSSINAFHENLINAESVPEVELNSTPYLLTYLESLFVDIDVNERFTIEQLKNDFQAFSNRLVKVLGDYKQLSREYLYGRDLVSGKWYCEVFEDEAAVMSMVLEKCQEVSVIESNFDWAGLYNKHTRLAVQYYGELELAPGDFYTLIIPEIYGDGFTVQDIDEMENLILENLLSPMLIADLFELMLEYVEEDIIKYHLEEYKVLFFEMLKQLILKKAIKPTKNANTFIA